MRVYVFCSLKSSTFTLCRFFRCWNKAFSIVFILLIKLPSVLTFTYLILVWYLGRFKSCSNNSYKYMHRYGKLNFFILHSVFAIAITFQTTNDGGWFRAKSGTGDAIRWSAIAMLCVCGSLIAAVVHGRLRCDVTRLSRKGRQE